MVFQKTDRLAENKIKLKMDYREKETLRNTRHSLKKQHDK